MICKCGNDEFYAHQITRHDIIVDITGAFKEDVGIYDAEAPYGPFSCTECAEVYEELSIDR